MTDEVLRERVARWPLVNLVHTLLSPLLAVWRANVGAGGARAGMLRGADALVDACLECGGAGGITSRMQGAFAQLRQSHPLVAELYRHNRLWEDMPAEMACGELRRALAATLDRQRAAALERLSGRSGVVAPLFRWLLTVGALLWFPFVQPVLEGVLAIPDIGWDLRVHGGRLASLLVSVLSGESLLRNATFLILWFTVIWLALRWGTQRRVSRFLSRLHSTVGRDPSLNLSAQALQWMDGLVRPIRDSGERMIDLARRAQALDGAAGGKGSNGSERASQESL